MCDFYSEIIKANGERFHRPHNSHSRMVRDAGWGENTPTRTVFWEFEWDPSEPLRGTGVRGDNPPEKVLEAAAKTVEELKLAHQGKFALRWQKQHGVDVRWYVARNTNTPKEVLTLLAKDQDADVRWYVAGNTNTPKEALTLLAKDSDTDVRRYVAQHASTPPEALTLLAKDSDTDVRRYVAQHASTPPEALTLLAKDSDTDVRRYVARNTSTPPEALTLLAKDQAADVRRYASR